jgi:Na+/H+-dicarboxylate symporter
MAMILQFFLVYVGFFFLFTRSNPFTYLKHIIPAQTMAFACASSAATIPMTLKSVQATGRVPKSIARFVVPLGATVNMDGGAIYFPCACIWLAVLNGIEPDIASYFLLVIISTIGSAGTAPVPSASLVLIITAYNTVFNTTGTPAGFSYILAIDWFMDRLRTTLNVTGDAVVTGLVAHLCPMGIDGDAVCIDDVEKISESGDGSSDEIVSSDDTIEPVVA